MITPFAIAAALQLPGDSGLPPDPIPFNVSSSFASEADVILQLTGTGTQVVGFGSVVAPGAKCIGIKVDPGTSVQPVIATFNGSSTGGLELSSGAMLLYANPNPSAGVTSMSLAYTTSCTVRVWVLG
jgi:hypothetical protein